MAKSRKGSRPEPKPADPNADTLVDKWNRIARNNPGMAMAIVAAATLTQGLGAVEKAISVYEKLSAHTAVEDKQPVTLTGRELDEHLQKMLEARDEWIKASLDAKPAPGVDPNAPPPFVLLDEYVKQHKTEEIPQSEVTILRDFIAKSQDQLDQMKARLNTLVPEPVPQNFKPAAAPVKDDKTPRF